MGTKSKRKLLRLFLRHQKIPNLEAEFALIKAAAESAQPGQARYQLEGRVKQLQHMLDYQRHRLQMADKAAQRRQLRDALWKEKLNVNATDSRRVDARNRAHVVAAQGLRPRRP